MDGLSKHCDKCGSMYKGEICKICFYSFKRIENEVGRIEAEYRRERKETVYPLKGLQSKQIQQFRRELLKDLRGGATGYQRGHRHKQPFGMHIV